MAWGARPPGPSTRYRLVCQDVTGAGRSASYCVSEAKVPRLAHGSDATRTVTRVGRSARPRCPDFGPGTTRLDRIMRAQGSSWTVLVLLLALAGCGSGDGRSPESDLPIRRLAAPTGNMFNVAWLPDGWIYFGRAETAGGDPETWRIRASGGAAEQLRLPDLAGCRQTEPARRQRGNCWLAESGAPRTVKRSAEIHHGGYLGPSPPASELPRCARRPAGCSEPKTPPVHLSRRDRPAGG